MKHRKQIRYVWCAEDDKYGLMAVFATKRSADKAFGGKEWRWLSGYGGTIQKRKVIA